MSERAKIIELIQQEKAFYLISHMLPDGDSVGSLLALGEVLREMGKDVTLFTPGRIPQKYNFLSGSETVKNEVLIDNPDIPVIILDSSDIERLGIFKDAVLNSRLIVNIDHHVTNQGYGTLNLVDAKAAATGEIIYHLLLDLGHNLNESVARSLYVAIATDTGSFKYDNTTSRTHRVIAHLLEFGLSPGTLSQIMFDERPLPFYIILKIALSTLELYESRKIAVMTLSKDIRQRSGASSDDLDGIVNYTRNIEGIELGILFYVENNAEVKVGFRSRALDVSVLAGKLNGGGHARAAGCRLKGDFQNVKERVMREAISMLRDLPD
jgi:bifunctional oligoribonuclease and PAP phosphatase NrnA